MATKETRHTVSLNDEARKYLNGRRNVSIKSITQAILACIQECMDRDEEKKQ